MTIELYLAGVILFSLMIYALTGGADFGGGVWDLFAMGSRAKMQRKVIARAIGPIWEANHVWLILVIVLLFIAFPKGFSALTTALHVPLTLMLFGIVLRGSAFVFRSYDDKSDVTQNRWSLVFSIASLVTPVMLGVCIGTVVSGRVRVDAVTGHVKTGFFAPWMALFPFSIGFFTLGLFAFLAASYLLLETKDQRLQEDFRLRALCSGVFVGVMAWFSFWLSGSEAPLVRKALGASVWAIPFQCIVGMIALSALFCLWFRYYGWARMLVVLQVVLVLLGWGGAQYPFLLVPDLTFQNTATLPIVMWTTLITLGVGSTVLLPSFVYLYYVFKGGASEAKSSDT